MNLIELAQSARHRAYAPYSGYQVGAAVRARSGEVWTGANIENVSFGATMCAERVALFSMVAAGQTELSEVVVATRDGGYPCGECLQVLIEFSPDPSKVRVTVVSEAGKVETKSLAELIPFGFRSSEVHRTDSGA